MPPRVTYLPTDLYRQVKETALQNTADEAVADLGWGSVLDSALSGLRDTYRRATNPASPGPGPEMPIVVSERPEVRGIDLPDYGRAAAGAPTFHVDDFSTGEDGETLYTPGAGPSRTADGAAAGMPRAPASSAPVGGEIDNSSRQAFVRTAWPHMLEAASGNRDAAEMMLAAAISENGDVGKGGGFIGNNFFGIKGSGDAGSVESGTWEQTASGPVSIRDRFAAYSSPVAGFGAFFGFLRDNPRYGAALARYAQTGDATQLFRDVNAAGYATDPQWASKVANIRANQVAPITQGLPDRPAAAAAPPVGTYAGEGAGGSGLVLNQFTRAQAEGLPPDVAASICGPTAALAFARANNGRMPTLTEARELATRLGLYSDDQGMAGPEAESKLLTALGVPHTLSQGADEAAIAAEVGAGRPVLVDTSGHYFGIEPGSYDANDRTFDFGGSAAALRASRGRTRYRLDELASLGMGAPRSTFTLGGR